MNIGDRLETSIWIDGTETPAQRKQFQNDVSDTIAANQDFHRVIVGPVMWEEKHPGDEQVPSVPAHISGPDVRLLIGRAYVLDHMPVESLFLSELEPSDLNRLRRLTRKAHARMYPHYGRLTDRQCDTLVNDLGPEAALDALRGSKVVIH